MFVDRLQREDVEIPGVGTITVRALTRMELLLAGKLSDQGVAAVERRMLSYAMVDPEMSEAEVERWQKCSPAGDIQPLMPAINRLSGIGQGAEKSGVQSVRGEPGA
ncbi:MAG: hypothetical protein V4515_14720 [Chloroflexota bacterium]